MPNRVWGVGRRLLSVAALKRYRCEVIASLAMFADWTGHDAQ
jgi:hypothetical protein